MSSKYIWGKDGEAVYGNDDDSSRSRWQGGLESEIAFWDEWFRTRGLHWPDDFAWKTDPASPFQPNLAELLNAPRGSRVRVLDVGAGPLTVLGKLLESHELQITAVDPLANAYDSLLAKYKISAPIRTIACEAENLLSMFPENHFDLVHASNSIDHGFDPIQSFRQMIAVVKPHGYVFMAHSVNEGTKQEYYGLHQWNFDVQDGHFVVWNPKVRTNVTVSLGDIAETEATIRDRWLFTKFCKLSPQEQKLSRLENKISGLEGRLAQVEAALAQTNAKFEIVTVRFNRYLNFPLIDAVRRFRRILLRLPPPSNS